jgi:hypothetical protein
LATKQTKALSNWWRTSGRRFVAAQWIRFITGFAVGCIAAVLIHLFILDTAFLPLLERTWARSPARRMFDGFSAYGLEFQALGLILLLGSAPWALRALWRWVRAWWAGMTSLMAVATASAVLWFLPFGTAHPTRRFTISLFVLVALGACELWRFQSEQSRYALPYLAIPAQNRRAPVPNSWQLASSDDPISEWDQDIIGRASVVEVLTEHIFVQRTPIVEVDGELGDGKSSVLNLLRRTIEGHAIVISFSAWLPGSEETLALDLFRDIATECKRAFYMPQLKKASIAYARTLSGSVSFLAGLKEIMPGQSQKQEIEEIKQVLGRVPVPVVVLLDEVDRMQREELLVLLKILRGASSMPGVTFICAFSEHEVRKTLKTSGDLSSDFFEKFFPVSVSVATPDPKMLGALFQRHILGATSKDNWFLGTEEKKFRELLDYVWEESLSRICTNLRKLRLLINDVMAAARPIAGEINAFDLIGIKSLARFAPDVHRLVRKNGRFLISQDDTWSKGLSLRSSKNPEAESFYALMDDGLSKSAEPSATGILLELLFPRWSTRNSERSRTSFVRSTDRETFAVEKRICSSEYFFIYFRAAVPDEMYSEAELSRLLSLLNGAGDEAERLRLFTEELGKLPTGHPRREDFLWKLGRSVEPRLNGSAAQDVAYAAAIRASDYAYDLMNIGEAARALNIVYEAAQKLSKSPKAQSILVEAMNRSTDDTFAVRLLEFIEHRDRNKILTNFSHIDPQQIRIAFVERMKNRYGTAVEAQGVDILRGDWRAFQLWADTSEADKVIEQSFWRRFIGSSRRKLGQALGFLYPVGYSWSEDPRPRIDKLFPTTEAQKLIDTLADDGLNEAETGAIQRYREMLGGKWFNIDNPQTWPSN